jgi:hypothetical protein
MNETGSHPGQTWLWLYTLWYQIPPFNGNANADLMVVVTMAVLSLALVRIPFHPLHPQHPTLGPDAPADLARLLPGPTWRLWAGRAGWRRDDPAPLGPLVRGWGDGVAALSPSTQQSRGGQLVGAT